MHRSADRPRIIRREPVAEGFSVETGVLSSTQNVQVNFRPRGWYRRDEWFGRNRDSALGMWSLSVPEMIGTSDGFVFGFEVPERWRRACCSSTRTTPACTATP